MKDSPNGLTRRDLLKNVGITSAIAGLWPGGTLDRLATGQEGGPPAGAKETLDELLENHRNRVLAADGRIGGTLAHVPLALIALYRIGGTAAQMRRFFGDASGPFTRPPLAATNDSLTVENWRSHLRKCVTFSRWFAFFDGWMARTSVAVVLEQSLPALIKGGVTAFDHSLIHMSYAIDYGEREEIAYALADWARNLPPELELDLAAAPVEPDVLLAEIVKYTSDLRLSPRGGNSGPIAWRLDQVRRYKEFPSQLKPVRIPKSDPLGGFSEIILRLFCETHEFTLLHAVTTCHSLRTLLPYVADPTKTLSAYWHSVCASYVSVRRMPQFDAAKQAVPTGGAGWKGITPRAAEMDRTIDESQYVHRVKLVYSCMREFKHYERDLYRAVSAREVEKASQIILG